MVLQIASDQSFRLSQEFRFFLKSVGDESGSARLCQKSSVPIGLSLSVPITFGVREIV